MNKKQLIFFCLGAVILLMGSSMTVVGASQPLQPSLSTTNPFLSLRDDIIVSGTLGENGWYTSSVMVTFNFSGPPAAWYYRINGAGWTEYTTPILIGDDGIYLIEATSDFEHIYNVTVKIDQTPPFVAITQPKHGYLYSCLLNYAFKIKNIYFTTLVIGRINVTVNATDNQSGVSRVEFFIDEDLRWTDSTAPYSWIWSDRVHLFPYKLKATAFDNAGNPSSFAISVWKIL